MNFSYAAELVCIGCQRRFALGEGEFTCPACGPLAGTLDVRYHTEALRGRFTWDALQSREASLWRYHELLPVTDPDALLTMPTGMTPLVPLPAGCDPALPRRVWVKDDTRLASGSTKDRATVVALSWARQAGYRRVAAASTGNAAASLACYAAHGGFEAYLLAPAKAPAAKLLQIRGYGARLLAVEGTYDQAFDLCAALCRETGCYNRNTATNPYLGEGKKTLALEIWDQLGGRIPDWVVVPVGDGCILGGVHKGFADLLALGLIERLPRLLAVQAEGSAALATAWAGGADRCEPVVADTVADSIAVNRPRDQHKALRAIRASQGRFVTVRDEAILEAMGHLASRAGFLVEPAAAASLAGLRAAIDEGWLDPDAEAVLLHSGHGLKDVAALRTIARDHPAAVVAPTLPAVLAAVRRS